jgi:predicted ATPase
LLLNGDILKLGTVQDVVNKIHGRHEFGLSITDDVDVYSWRFSGDRLDMSMDIKCVSEDSTIFSEVRDLNRLLPYQKAGAARISYTLENLTYITAERIGPQEFYPLEDLGADRSVGPKGGRAVSRLFRLKEKLVPDAIALDSAPPTLMRQVEAWMRVFFPGCGLDVTPIPRMNAVTLGIRTSDETDYHRPINVGFGLTQVLPILVAVLSASKDDLILIENPEVHLHPAGQALMGGFLSSAASSGIQIILESHSDHVLNGIRRKVRAKILTPNQTAIHFFRQAPEGLDQVVSPQLDSNGNLDTWPDGFFDQFDKDMNHFAGWGE